MQRNERILLSEMTSSESGRREPRTAELEAPGPEPRQWESNRKRTYVLLGAAISQFPIWGFAMSYGVFQEYFSNDWPLHGGREATGVIGTTFNGVMYLSMPFLFALFTRRWARRRQLAALCGAALTCVSFLASSLVTSASGLVVTQGVMAALGGALVYSPTTLSLGEWYNTSNRAVAYGVVLSCKNIVGSCCPFLFRYLLDRHGLRTTLQLWTAIVAGTSIVATLLVPAHPSIISSSSVHHRRDIPWHFLRHETFYIYSVAIILQSAGYGIPQTYLNTYAHDVILLSQATATLMLTIFNLPGIFASSLFGYLSDNKYCQLGATAVTSIPAVSSALSAFLLWGLTSRGTLGLLVSFSATFGFFAGGYSATWGGIINELEREAAARNEAIDTGMIYGMLNGARGIGYVSGGLAGVPLLKAGSTSHSGAFAYGTAYGPLIIFTGLTSVFGGCGLLSRLAHDLRGSF